MKCESSDDSVRLVPENGPESELLGNLAASGVAIQKVEAANPRRVGFDSGSAGDPVLLVTIGMKK